MLRPIPPSTLCRIFREHEQLAAMERDEPPAWWEIGLVAGAWVLGVLFLFALDGGYIHVL